MATHQKGNTSMYRVELQLFTTLNCNLECKYCSEDVGEIKNSQGTIEYTLDQLEEFVNTHFHDKEIIVTFYGGEPTLNRQFIEDVVKRFPLWRYQIQTNGLLIKELSPKIIKQFDNILISIDGKKDVTDMFRGKGTYDQVLDNLNYLRWSTGSYKTARCTWANPSPKAEDILHLMDLFNYVYFQFPHNEWVYTEQYMREMKVALEQLVYLFLNANRVFPIIPLMAFARNILFPSRAKELYDGETQCRVSSHLINILPNGNIVACPDYAYNERMTHGSVIHNFIKPSPLKRLRIFPCKSCEAFGVCRTNCVKGFDQSYVMNDSLYKETVVDSNCELIQYMYALFTKGDLVKWYSALPLSDKRELINCPIYEYVEVMP